MSTGDLLIGQTVDAYLVLQLLGEGGMGRVYLAEHTLLSRVCALKFVRAERANELGKERFLREMAMMARIAHPNVAAIYDGRILDDGNALMAIEYVDGNTLRSVLDVAGCLSWVRVLALLRQLAAALDALHSQAVLHRDLKPENVMVRARDDGNEDAVVIDLGLAKLLAGDASAITEEGFVVGTALYMSPEQLTGDPMDITSDVYVLGLMTFEMLTGELPFPAKPIARLVIPPKALSDVRSDGDWPDGTDQVIRRALEHEPGARFATCGEFVEALEDLESVATTVPAGERSMSHVAVSGDTAPRIDHARGAINVRPHYAWQRLWAARGDVIQVTADGFLEPPRDWTYFRVNTHLAPLATLENITALVLLGEPGMGKSTELEAGRAIAALRAQQSGDVVICANLRDFASDERLHAEVFANPIVEAWRGGSHQLTIFLDSLDEGLLELRPLATRILAELVQLGSDRLAVRIACRTAEWPMVLERGLVDLFGHENVGVYEIVQLTADDARAAAQAEGIADPDTFLREITEKEVGPLAARPVSLRFLVDTFRRRGELPRSQVDLYTQGTRLLAAELNESRIASGRIGRLTADERLVVAARIAAIMIYGNYAVVALSPDEPQIGTGDLTLRELVGGREEIYGVSVLVDETAVREALATALFSARGPARLGWAHQTYAEFLAAWYLAGHSTPILSVRQLLAVSDTDQSKLVPQLHETAGWLAALREDVRSWVVTVEPEVVLRADIAVADHVVRALVVSALLAAADRDELHTVWYEHQHKMAHLSHPGLANQLEGVLRDSARRGAVKELAITIARAARVEALAPAAADVALDVQAPYGVRTRAALLVAELGDRSSRERLRPLPEASGDQHGLDDLTLELKGYALQALWPSVLGLSDVLGLIQAPHNTTYGAYRRLVRDVAGSLTPDDLLTVLAWTRRQSHPARVMPGAGVDDITERSLLLAWESIDRPGVLDAFVDIAIDRVRQHESIIAGEEGKEFAKRVGDDTVRRRLFLARYVQRFVEDAAPLKDIGIFVWTGDAPLANAEDVPWIIEQLRGSGRSSPLEAAWVEFLAYAFHPSNGEAVNALLEAVDDVPVLRERFSGYIDPVLVDSPEAVEMRKREKWLHRPPPQEEEPSDAAPSVERLEHLLERAESGDPDAWWHINFEFARPEEGRFLQEVELDLTRRPLWMRLPTELQRRLLNVAERSIYLRDAEASEWLGKDVMWRPARAGYCALVLLSQLAPERLDQVPVAQWKGWAPAIVAFDRAEEGVIGRRLLMEAWMRAPDAIISVVRALMEHDERRHGTVFSHKRLRPIRDGRLNEFLLAFASERGRTDMAVEEILGELLYRNYEPAFAYAVSLLPRDWSQADDYTQRRALAAARALLLEMPRNAFEVLWRFMEAAPEFGHSLLGSIASRSDWPFGTVSSQRQREAAMEEKDRRIDHEDGSEESNLSIGVGSRGEDAEHGASPPEARTLTGEQYVRLYAYMLREFPPSHDPERPGALMYEVTPRHSVADARNQIPQVLAARGTADSVRALEALRQQYPEDAIVAYSLREGRERYRRNAWKPPTPREILHLAVDDTRAGSA